jgi:membrane protein implicated in regulation of membrane protease activity
VTAFLIIGVLGIALLVLTSVVDGVLDLFDSDGLLSGPALATFLAAFGFGGAIAVYAGASGVVAVGAGIASGGALAGVVAAAMSSLMKMRTDATPASSDLPGRNGTVITTVPPGGLGEVSVAIGGQPVKLSARAVGDEPLPAGTAIVVTAALSPTSVIVERSNP